MPSYRYTREIKPEDLQTPPPPEYTKKEKAKNWWLYHKRIVLVGLVVAVLLGFLIHDIVGQVEPDFTIGIVTPYSMPDELNQKLREGLLPYVEDVNGDGRVEVQVDVYTIEVPGVGGGAEESVAAQEDTTGDPYMQLAGMVRLAGAFEAGDPVVFLVEEEAAAVYQAEYLLFGYQDGSLAPAEVELGQVSVPLGEIAGLAQMDLDFEYFETTIDGHAILDGYLVGIRGLYGSNLEDAKGGPERWEYASGLLQLLVDGAPPERQGQ